MGLVIGIDEAGYGPNLGPLVVTTTVWEVPGHPRETDFWAALADVVDSSLSADGSRLHVADSKQVYNPSRGIGRLERSVLCALNLCGLFPAGFRELCQALSPADSDSRFNEPWLEGADLPLPVTEHAVRLGEIVERWDDCGRRAGVRLRAIRSDVVLTRRFNRLTREYGSKGLTLSRVTLRLLRSVWNPDDAEPTRVVADKHGGRNRYDGLLAEVIGDRMIFRGTESTSHSDYRVGETAIRFQAKAETHLPVALASMVSKYVRELSMLLFNRFWTECVPNLRPTKGYPVDAARFKAQIAETQAALGIEDDMLWRER